jgi:hypothetical protein
MRYNRWSKMWHTLCDLMNQEHGVTTYRCVAREQLQNDACAILLKNMCMDLRKSGRGRVFVTSK